jgi:hypothetical protein
VSQVIGQGRIGDSHLPSFLGREYWQRAQKVLFISIERDSITNTQTTPMPGGGTEFGKGKDHWLLVRLGKQFKVVSLHQDISTVTWEKIILLTLADSPAFRETKKQ